MAAVCICLVWSGHLVDVPRRGVDVHREARGGMSGIAAAEVRAERYALPVIRKVCWRASLSVLWQCLVNVHLIPLRLPKIHFSDGIYHFLGLSHTRTTFAAHSFIFHYNLTF